METKKAVGHYENRVDVPMSPPGILYYANNLSMMLVGKTPNCKFVPRDARATRMHSALCTTARCPSVCHIIRMEMVLYLRLQNLIIVFLSRMLYRDFY